MSHDANKRQQLTPGISEFYLRLWCSQKQCGETWQSINGYMAIIVVTVLWIACFVFSSTALSAEPSSVRLDKVSVHLFLENTGTLSEDITLIVGFSAWNFRPSGLGFSADDRFDSFLIKVWLSSEGETYQAGEQARVKVKSEKTGKIIFEAPIKGVYIGREGRTVKPLFVSGHVCEPLVVEVQGRPKTITKILPFKCGE